MAFDEVVQGKGSKTVNIRTNVMDTNALPIPPVYIFPDGMDVIYEPVGFAGATDATRVNLVIRPGLDVIAKIENLEGWVISEIAQSSERIVSQPLSVEQVVDRFSSNIKHHEKYGPSLKLKMQLTGKNATRFWTSDKHERMSPDQWKGCSIIPRVTARSVWIVGNGREFGVTLEVTDAIICDPIRRACPF